MEIKIDLPLTAEKVAQLHAGDTVKLSGIIYTARDAAHKRLIAALDANEPLPVELKDQTIYFAGPCPAPPGRPIGSSGPTTSGRMDAYSPRLIRECGLRGMIGKACDRTTSRSGESSPCAPAEPERSEGACRRLRNSRWTSAT